MNRRSLVPAGLLFVPFAVLAAASPVDVRVFQVTAERPLRELRTWIPFSAYHADTVPCLDLDASGPACPYAGFGITLEAGSEVDESVPLSFVRIRFDGGDPEKELGSIRPVLDGLRRRNPDLSVIAEFRTPPAEMKLGGEISNGWIRPECIGDFADHCVRCLCTCRTEGLKVVAVTHRDGPDSELYGPRPGCIWGPGEERPLLGRILPERMVSAGFGDIAIWYQDGEPRRWRQSNWVWTLDDTHVRANVKAVAWDFLGERPHDILRLRRHHPDIRLHAVSSDDGSAARERTLLGWSRAALRAFNAGCSSFVCGSAVPTGSAQAAAFRSVAAFVRPGADVLGAAYDNPRAQAVAAFANPDGTRVVVAVSGSPAGAEEDRPVPADPKLQLQVRFKDLYSSFQLPSGSVTTILLK